MRIHINQFDEVVHQLQYKNDIRIPAEHLSLFVFLCLSVIFEKLYLNLSLLDFE